MNATMNLTGWVVIGTYEDEGHWVSEILAEGFATEEEARRARSQMARSCPEVAMDVDTAARSVNWLTR